jgi:hypothetical protein
MNRSRKTRCLTCNFVVSIYGKHTSCRICRGRNKRARLKAIGHQVGLNVFNQIFGRNA